MKHLLGILVIVLATGVARGDDWADFWRGRENYWRLDDAERHLRSMSRSLRVIASSQWQQEQPVVEYVPPFPGGPLYTRQLLQQSAVSSRYASIKRRQQQQKERRERTYAKLREARLERELLEEKE